MLSIQPSCRSRATTRARGLTLIEMLVGMAITLVMMAAVVKLFADISAGVRNRQGKMELNAAIRIARSQLYSDLAGATCLQYPNDAFQAMLKPDMNNPPDGYFEYVEGDYSDDNPSRLLDGIPDNGEIDYAVSSIPSGGDPSIVIPPYSDRTPDPAVDVTNGGGLGDYDDILAMTVRNEVSPFHGRGRALRPGGDPRVAADWIDMPIESPLAEVVWFAVENPVNSPPLEPGMRTIYRRTLLIVPWYGTATNTSLNATGTDPLLDLRNYGLSFAQQLRILRAFQARYDISVRLERGRIVPNTLADLSRRENRFSHLPDNTVADPDIFYFPHLFPYDVNNFAANLYSSPNAGYDDGTIRSSLQPLGTEQIILANENAIKWFTVDPTIFSNTAQERNGEDLVLSDVLAFDVQVYDPGAPLYEYQGTVIQPSGTPNGPFLAAVGAGPGAITGFGTYVDLGWNNSGLYNYVTIRDTIPIAPATVFQQERRVGWHPFIPTQFDRAPSTYDTWTTYYETDQIDQESTPFYANSNAGWATWQVGNVDQGTNGLDDDGLNGPDDPRERETSPPYPYPLQGIQVKMRIYDPSTRQIRETTVRRSLAK